jgi:hypothetical protein
VAAAEIDQARRRRKRRRRRSISIWETETCIKF